MPLRSALSALFILHGLVHVVGFLGPLELLPGVPFQTTMFGRPIVNSSTEARSLAVVWLLLALAYAVAALAVFVQADWWLLFTIMTTLLSLLLCLVAWPASAVGVAIDGLILTVCVWTQHEQLALGLLALLRYLSN